MDNRNNLQGFEPGRFQLQIYQMIFAERRTGEHRRAMAIEVENVRGLPEKVPASLAAALSDESVRCGVTEAVGAVGGGTFPGVELPSWAVELSHPSLTELARALRDGNPPVVGRILDDRLTLDLRTVLPGQEGELARRVSEAVAAEGEA